MKSSEDYLDELLKSMNEEMPEESPLSRFGLEGGVPTADAGMGKMDQAMIDALLSGASPSEPEIEDLETLVSYEDMEAEEEITTEDSILPDMSVIEKSAVPDMTVIEDSFTDAMEGIDEKEAIEETEESSMLAQLLAEMQDEVEQGALDVFDDVEFMDEESIDALLSAAKEGDDSLYEEGAVSFDMLEGSDMAQIDALLGMAEEDGLEDDSVLLRMLEESEAASEDLVNDESEVMEVDEAELEAILSGGSTSSGEENSKENKKKKKKEKKEKVKKEKKDSPLKAILEKIISLLMEEIPDDEFSEEDGINLSEENKNILNELDKEKDKKVKASDKKKEKKKKEAKKEEKKEPKKEKIKKEKKPKKEKSVKDAGAAKPERKIPRKKIIVTFVFAFSVLALVLLVEMLVPPMLTQSRARSAYDKGNYYEAYKEYYGQKLSEEDEKRFQGAKTIIRMQSNLDGYDSYLKMNKEVKALHSLLEGVKVKFNVFMKAEEYNVLSQVSAVYQQILDILSNKYQLSEEAALDLVEEKSDAVYTRKLEAIVEGKPYIEENDKQMNQEDMLPEEEAIFSN